MGGDLARNGEFLSAITVEMWLPHTMVDRPRFPHISDSNQGATPRAFLNQASDAAWWGCSYDCVILLGGRNSHGIESGGDRVDIYGSFRILRRTSN